MFPATSVSSPASPTVCWLLLSDGVLELEFQSDFSQKQERDMAYLSDYSLVSKTFHPYGSTKERFSILRSKVPVELPEGIPGRAK